MDGNEIVNTDLNEYIEAETVSEDSESSNLTEGPAEVYDGYRTIFICSF